MREEKNGTILLQIWHQDVTNTILEIANWLEYLGCPHASYEIDDPKAPMFFLTKHSEWRGEVFIDILFCNASYEVKKLFVARFNHLHVRDTDVYSRT